VYAFQNGSPGDIFVQKAPAATILTLAEALKEIFEADSEIQILGTRHGEKLYETLLNREEMAKAEDRGGYYRIPADIRDLNYSLYFTKGQIDVSLAEEYTSQNTHRMNHAEMVELLLKLECVQQALKTRTVTI
jgi:UDP-glucose 4-epimerase